MKTVKHNIVVVMGPSIYAYDVASKVGLMYLNRFCIDEEAAFELNGVYSIQRNGTHIFWNEMRRLAKRKSKDFKIHFLYTRPFRHFTDEWMDELRSFILKGMNMYKIKTVMVTILRGDEHPGPDNIFFIFKMPDGRTPRGRPSRESIP